MGKAKTKIQDEGKQVSETQKLLVKAPEAAALLSLSERKLWEMRNCRQIPHVKIGRAVRYAVADLEAWIEQQKTEALAC
jgi:excisionase family DNA binding protein